MNACTKKLIAIAAVFAMFAAPISAFTITSDDSSADTIDCKTYYYDQLDGLSKLVYDAVTSMNSAVTTKSIPVDESMFTKIVTLTKDSAEKQAGEAVKKAISALKYDNTEYSIWLDFNSNFTYALLFESDLPVKLDITVNTYDFEKAQIASKIMSTKLRAEAIEITGTTIQEKVTQIHDAVLSLLTYPAAADMNKPFVRSIWNAFDGDRTVVCEGYAKAFKFLCDMHDAPCIIVTGMAKGSATSEAEGHMWNYVLMDDNRWYIVDCTWDDQTTPVQTYLLAGSESMGFNIKVKESHNSNDMIKDGFEIPALSAVTYGDPTQQYKVTFLDAKDGDVLSSQYVVVNNEAEFYVPESNAVHIFKEWCNAEDDSIWNFSNKITKDETVYAVWEDLNLGDVAYKFILKMNDKIVDGWYNKIGDVLTLPAEAPTMPDGNFLGWNTSPNGKGVFFEPGSEIVLSQDTELYAIFESTVDTSPYNIDTTIGNMSEFLKGETISGVNNTVLAIGGFSAIIVLIAVLLIARKN